MEPLKKKMRSEGAPAVPVFTAPQAGDGTDAFECIARDGRPVVFEDIWRNGAQWAAMREWASFEHLARRIGADRCVDVACSENHVFSGDSHARQTAKLPFAEVAALGCALRDDAPHFARGQGMHYYVCQCPLHCLPLGDDLRACLPELLRQVMRRKQQGRNRQRRQQQPPQRSPPPRPSPALEEDGVELLAPNLWLSLERSRSNIHYDANDGLLLMLGGSKRIHLWPPSAALRLRARSVCSGAPHHATLDVTPGIGRSGAEAGFGHLEEREVGAGDDRGCVATLRPNEALFIPEGWWHCVDSEPGTVAVNVWCPGMQAEACFDAEREEYLLRALLQRAAHRLRHNQLLSFNATAKAVAASAAGSAADAAAAAAAAAATPPLHELEHHRLEDAVAALRGAEQLVELPRLVQTAPGAWKSMLLGCRGATASQLTSQWEEMESQGHDLEAFYGAVLDEPFGESEARRVRHALLDKTEAFTRQLLSDRLAQLLE